MKNKKLKSLEESNDESMKFASLIGYNSPRPNGIACPNCGEELMDTNPMVTLTSYPPQKDIHCNKCNYHGLRYC
jgi:hypothetical protein